MKKLFFLLLISSLLLNPITAMSDQAASSDQLSKSAQKIKDKLEEQTKFQKFVAKLSTVSEKLSNTSEKISAAFNWVADRIDTILTKKGAIKTLIILGPLFTVYCYLFPPAPVQSLIKYILGSAAQGASDIADSFAESIDNNNGKVTQALNKVTKKLGELEGVYRAGQEIGHTGGFWEGMWNYPGATFGMVVGNGIEKGISIGIPFVMGLFMQEYIKASVASKTSTPK